MSTTIEIAHLTREFPGPAGVTRAVDGISLTIDPGEMFFLLGPSGCGKTTLLRMIAGFLEPTSGSITFNGKDVTRLPPNKRNTGMVFQSYALWPHMTVGGNVGFGLGVRKVPKPDRAKRVEDALAQVHMAGYADRKPNQLSGGQQQRVALARALVIRPDVLLLDEPLSNLDAKLRIELRSEIRRICKEAGITTVYVTHDQKEALSMADRIAVLQAGRVRQVGTPTQLYRRPADTFVATFLGETNLIRGTASPAEDGLVRVSFAGGALLARAGADTPTAGEVIASVRPESLRLTDQNTNIISGVHRRAVYLGELAQHEIEVSGVGGVHVSVMNPRDSRGPMPGDAAHLAADPEDVMVLRVPDRPDGLA